ncbi:MAG: hypothetical protein AB2767_02540 [Candidatus Thiodiazotropha taylori]|nr:hypothetical protein [Candidatus Thiodiazotropha taylori]MCG8086486.1 hypothetical protein [Candidatus Thiodiazotropha taylori]MCG8091663.1 hypothetical protein [Candidatus Thiodiazotropha taylori]MCW4277044.1 hypothetical protein [Candidatus Thiodiazotropha taylori]
MKLFHQTRFQRRWLAALLTLFALLPAKELLAEAAQSEAAQQPVGLNGDWCREKKRMITHYAVKPESLFIRGGRSGRTHRADLNCNDDYTECQAKTVRGWGTPVTEILRLKGEEMHLTRIWGGAWKDKTYQFVFTRCPKW